MRIALVNPHWSYEGSIYFGCRAPHLPLELGYSKALLERAGHACLMVDGQLDEQDNTSLAERVAAFAPDMTVVTTAPTYLFWRCAPPELRIPAGFLRRLGRRGGQRVVVGPHGSVTPRSVLDKLAADIVVRGECEEVILHLAEAGDELARVPSIAFVDGSQVRITGGPAAARFTDLAPLQWPDAWIARHQHHHHRFEREPAGPGAEVEASRGCPYSCTFCAKIDFRDAYRRRDLPNLLQEIDVLRTQGVEYLYFVDEIFLPQKPLLEALEKRAIKFGIQTRIDLWKPDLLELLGRAGCVSIEAGVESLTVEGRNLLDKRCRMDTEQLADALILARRHVPFVQANLIAMAQDEEDLVAAWRMRLQQHGVWANDPVPLFPYPSSPDYRRLWGEPDDRAWERAHAHYLAQFDTMSDIQDATPVALPELERECGR
jgi:anaerobic magnesium-protoporphyrin IX monomethyl ester cyclase